MMNPQQLDVHWYEFLEEVASAFYGALGIIRARKNETVPLSPLLAVRSGYAESPGWFMVQAAEFAPEPLSVQTLRVRDIYASEKIVSALLELMASETWFDRNATQDYTLTDAGRAMLEKIFARRRGWLQEMDVPLTDAILRGEKILCALIQASCATEHAWCVQHSRRRAPLQEISPLGKIFQALEDVNAFRDDAHMAAWQPLGVTGNQWETFAFVCDEKANDANALFEQLHYRGFTRAEFADALNALAWRGWIERADDETFRASAQGRAVRTDVERETDNFFYAPWRLLSSNELTQFHSDLSALREALLALST